MLFTLDEAPPPRLPLPSLPPDVLVRDRPDGEATGRMLISCGPVVGPIM